MRHRQFAVYILASLSRRLYVGVTGNLLARVWQHRLALGRGFTSRYRITRLVWYELTPNVRAAIRREKQIKGWSREKKLRMIEQSNAGWEDLAENWFRESPGQIPRFARDDSGYSPKPICATGAKLNR